MKMSPGTSNALANLELKVSKRRLAEVALYGRDRSAGFHARTFLVGLAKRNARARQTHPGKRSKR